MKNLLFIVLMSLACSAKAHPCPPIPAPPGPPSPSPPSQAEVLKMEINKERLKSGALQIVSTPELDCAAKVHAIDIAQMRSCTHTGSDGSQFWERARKCGTRASGEIVACGYKDEKSTVNGWMNSPGHRAIMLDPKQIAMGAYRAGDYWVVIFRK